MALTKNVLARPSIVTSAVTRTILALVGNGSASEQVNRTSRLSDSTVGAEGSKLQVAAVTAHVRVLLYSKRISRVVTSASMGPSLALVIRNAPAASAPEAETSNSSGLWPSPRRTS